MTSSSGSKSPTKQQRKTVELHNIHKNEADRQRLIEVGGYEQVPCLFIDGKPLYESLDIIDWLKAHPQA